MCESNDDSASTGTDRVTECDSATVDVDLCRVEVHDLFSGSDDDGECFVEFEQGDVVLRDTSGLEGLRNGERGCCGEVNGCGGGIGEACEGWISDRFL